MQNIQGRRNRKNPKSSTRAVLLLPPASKTKRCWCSPCDWFVCLGDATPVALICPSLKGLPEASTLHRRQLSLIFLPSPTVKVSSPFLPLFLLPGGFQSQDPWLIQVLLLLSSQNVFMTRLDPFGLVTAPLLLLLTQQETFKWQI